MRLPSLSLSTRFFAALIVLLAALGGAVVVAVHGLGQVQDANTLVYSDTFLTEEATSNLAVQLSRADLAAVKVTLARTPEDAAVRRTELDRLVIPDVVTAINRVEQLHAGDDPDELAQIRRIRPAWDRFVAITKRGVLASGVAAPGAPSADRAAISRTLDPLLSFVRDLQSVEVDEAGEAHESASAVERRSMRWLTLAAGLTVLAALGMVRIGIALRTLVERQSAEGRYAETSAVRRRAAGHRARGRGPGAPAPPRRAPLPGATRWCWRRNNSADRLEPRTSLAELDRAARTLGGADAALVPGRPLRPQRTPRAATTRR